MISYMTRHKKALGFLTLFLFAISLLCLHCFSTKSLTENERFEAFSTEIFQNALTGNTLNLHYTLSDPQKLDIHTKEVTLGRISTNRNEIYAQYAQYENALRDFAYSELSTPNQLILDTLLLEFHTEQTISDCYLLEEYLSPNLGIQAQLPILLAEYTFRTEQDIIDYLTLLKDIRPYFESIMAYEKCKSEAGLFMCDETVDRIQDQCFSFISDPDHHFMLEVFSDKINECSTLSEEEKTELLALHQTILKNDVIPAYQYLITSLELLRGTGRSASGLYYYPDGTKYYQYLLRSSAGIYTSIPVLEYQLSKKLYDESRTINQLISENPGLLEQYTALMLSANPDTLSTDTEDSVKDSETSTISTPETMMNFLVEAIQQDFPDPVSTDYELCYVHEAMEDYLSPAFYLTPPIDTGTPNTIYLNRASLPSVLETFTTLAHEGFPGHLYQTTCFTSEKAHPVRHLFSCNGYVEGWATYAESYAYQYAADALNLAPALTQLAFLNRSITLCLYSLLDIGIHYRGWTENETASFLKNFNITEPTAIHEIYLYIVENPGNYLQYYCGYLNFSLLKENQQKKLGSAFHLKNFHQTILKIGPVPFPVLEKYINHEFFAKNLL